MIPIHRVAFSLFGLCLLAPLKAEEVIQSQREGGVNWSTGVIYAYGYGPVPDALSGSPRGQLMARRVAVVDAYRALGEMTAGVQVTSQTTVRDTMLESKTVKTRVEALIRGAQMAEENVQNGLVKVKMVMPIGGDLLDIVLPREKFEQLTQTDISSMSTLLLRLAHHLVSRLFRDALAAPKLEDFSIQNDAELKAAKRILKWLETINASTVHDILQEAIERYENRKVYSGLLVDASQVSDFKLATVPWIRTEDGRKLYPNPDTDYDHVRNKRAVSYDLDIEDAIANSRIAQTPLVVKALGVYKARQCELVVSEEDAKKVEHIGVTTDVLNKARVMIVVAR